MKLIGFSVTNFRSITKAHKLPISDSTILVGKNNEGKSNILHALTISMELVRLHALGRKRTIPSRFGARQSYKWERDFPVQMQEKRPNGKSIFRLEFELNEEEILEFKNEVKSSLNGTLPIEVSIGEDYYPIFKVPKKGKGGNALSQKARKIALFVGSRIELTYIPAVRTSSAAISVVEKMLAVELAVLEKDPNYQVALEQISQLQQPILDMISEKITNPLKQFIPQINNVKVSISQEKRYRALRGACEVYIDDGNPTLLERKGDGVKSLAAISLLQGTGERPGASILALEEPESHLHPSAIHRLRGVIEELSRDHQVVITTHCPLFVDRNKVSKNIIISESKAKPVKNISEVREVLGVRSSDNLINARLVLIVEGKEDKIALNAIFSATSTSLAKYIKDGSLYIDPCNGAGNLCYKLNLNQTAVCLTHVLMDNDKAGNEAIEKAEEEGLVKAADYNLTVCNGMPTAEFEDCLNVAVYQSAVKSEFGVKLTGRNFRGNKKWSERMRKTFLGQGKTWSEGVEKKLKYVVAKSVEDNPLEALSEYKRSSIDALIASLEEKLDT